MLPWKPTVPSAEAIPPYISDYGSMDVLMGRGTPSVRHKGNIFFRSLIDKRKAEYIQCTTNEDKDIMARGIVDAVASHQGRFLQKVETAAQAASMGVPQGVQGNVWVLADEEVVLCKVKQAFRDLFKRGTRSTGDTDPSSGSPSRRRQRGDAVGEEEDKKPAALSQSVAAPQPPLDSMSLQFLRNQHQRGGEHFSQGMQYPETSAGAARQINALLQQQQQQQQQQNQNLYQQHWLGTSQAATRQQGSLPPSSLSFLPSNSIPFQGVGNMPLSESERIKLALEIHYHRMRTGGANVLAPQHSAPPMSTDTQTPRVAAPASTMAGGGQATSGSTREGNPNDAMLSLLLERAIAQQQQQQQASNQLAYSLPSFLQEQRAGMIPSQQPTTHAGTLNSMVLGMLQQQRQQQHHQQPSPLEDLQRIQAERLREAQFLAASRSSDADAARLPPREMPPARLPPEPKTSDVSSKSSGPSSESGGDVDAKKTDRISLGAPTEKLPETGLSPAARLPQESKGRSSDISSSGGAEDTKRTDRKRRRGSDSEKKPRASSTR